MAKSKNKARVLIALTESSPVDELWRAAVARLGAGGADLLALFLAEDHWHRAASLPFTREISRLSGVDADFTVQRAHQVQEDAIERTKQLIGKLAADAKLPLGFEVLPGADRKKLRELASGTSAVVIAPSFIIRLPLFAELENLDCHIELVEVTRKDRADETAKR
jgi:hypothetical protein